MHNRVRKKHKTFKQPCQSFSTNSETHIIYNALVQGAFLVGCRIENSHYVAGNKKAHRHIDRNTYYIPTNIIKVHGKGKGLG